jgi:hypothetical protein
VALALTGTGALFYLFRLGTLSPGATGTVTQRTERYRPMLRLLSDDDLLPVRNHPKLLRQMRAQRTTIFRGYVRCLSRDYACLLASLSLMSLQSEIDRPDLSKAVLLNRLTFAAVLCRLDVMMCLYRFGICRVEVSGLVAALDTLRLQTLRNQTLQTQAVGLAA